FIQLKLTTELTNILTEKKRRHPHTTHAFGAHKIVIEKTLPPISTQLINVYIQVVCLHPTTY
ncbi:hypothetical protein BLA29_001600, partial [Euroglyphus maynei]